MVDLIDFLPLLADREAIVLGQGAAMPMRIRIDELGGTGQPLNKNPSFSRDTEAEGMDRSALDAIVTRWRTTSRERTWRGELPPSPIPQPTPPLARRARAVASRHERDQVASIFQSILQRVEPKRIRKVEDARDPNSRALDLSTPASGVPTSGRRVALGAQVSAASSVQSRLSTTEDHGRLPPAGAASRRSAGLCGRGPGGCPDRRGGQGD